MTLDQNSALLAIASSLRVGCASTGSWGSGFVHSSGLVVTAAHVISGCDPKSIQLIPNSGSVVSGTQQAIDPRLDLAIIKPAQDLGTGMRVRTGPLSIGMPVATWGYPMGYLGIRSLLTMGYLAGESPNVSNGPARLWVNGAFNSGNSGGPLVLASTGEVIGVVSAKLAPVPPEIEQALQVMANQPSGVIYTATKPDGSTQNLSEGQVIATVLQYLRGQVQLVIGMAVSANDLSAFLTANGIAP